MEPINFNALSQYGAIGFMLLASIGSVVALWRALQEKEKSCRSERDADRAQNRVERESDRQAHLVALHDVTEGVREVGELSRANAQALARLEMKG